MRRTKKIRHRGGYVRLVTTGRQTGPALFAPTPESSPHHRRPSSTFLRSTTLDCCASQHGHRATEAGNPALPAAQERAIERDARELVEAMDRAPTRQDAAGAAHEVRVRRGYADEADGPLWGRRSARARPGARSAISTRTSTAPSGLDQAQAPEVGAVGGAVAIRAQKNRLKAGVSARFRGSILKTGFRMDSVQPSAPTPNPLILWRARRDSNARPLPSEGSTLSS